MQVRNTSTNAEVMVRMVDGFSTGGLVLDFAMFNKLDTDGLGYKQGLFVVPIY